MLDNEPIERGTLQLKPEAAVELETTDENTEAQDPLEASEPQYVYLDGQRYEQVTTLIARPTQTQRIWQYVFGFLKALIGLCVLFLILALLVE